ncbi:hypothetical protein BC936DRAFT_147075 [Jimgerdemannia flammicorona]|uniref:non-specific serine/threonine protein kinase n=1 Tax=Jimgerdemannia flammicorona TaxID=994334 RepID=A0A433D687_9FUNG|nr:hypothetical protein BC936DRAFT_147075 [Jimgerdemannia flammicorona]
MARMQGPGHATSVMGIMGVSQFKGKYVIVMECANGGNLSKYRSLHHPKNWAGVCLTLETVARRLEELHLTSIIHGDLHPGNVVFHNDHPYLIDVGLSVTECWALDPQDRPTALELRFRLSNLAWYYSIVSPWGWSTIPTETTEFIKMRQEIPDEDENNSSNNFNFADGNSNNAVSDGDNGSNFDFVDGESNYTVSDDDHNSNKNLTFADCESNYIVSHRRQNHTLSNGATEAHAPHSSVIMPTTGSNSQQGTSGGMPRRHRFYTRIIMGALYIPTSIAIAIYCIAVFVPFSIWGLFSENVHGTGALSTPARLYPPRKRCLWCRDCIYCSVPVESVNRRPPSVINRGYPSGFNRPV